MEHKYPPDRTTIAFRIMIMAAIQCGFTAYLWFVKDTGIAPAILFVVVVYVSIPLVKLLFMPVALQIDSTGVTDYTRPLGFIPWSNIKGGRIGSAGLGDFLELDLHNPSEVSSRQSIIGELLMDFGRRKGIAPSIALTFVDCRQREILDIVQSCAHPNPPVDNPQGVWTEDLKGRLALPPETRKRRSWFAP
jgi:hypothetical protein